MELQEEALAELGHPGRILSSWGKGSRRSPFERPAAEASANLEAPCVDSPEFEPFVAAVVKLLGPSRAAGHEIQLELDIGLALDPLESVTASEVLSPSALKVLADAGIDLRVSVYLADGEDEDTTGEEYAH